MPRNSQGLYTLPAGNPVVPNTLIEANWANPTMDDIAAALTGSLPRDGSAPMTGPLTLASGMPTAARHATSKAYVDQFLAFASGLPIGAVTAYAGATVPGGYLECNGQAVSRTTYAALFTAIGTTYGAGDASTTFNVPDMRDEFIRGKSDARVVGSKQAAAFASHIHATSDPGHGHALSDPGHVHGASQPAHTHGVNDYGHSHSQMVSGTPGSGFAYGTGNLTNGTTSTSGANISIQAGGGDAVTVNGAATGVSLANNTTGLSIGAAGGDETRPQNIAQIYIIKAVNDASGPIAVTGITTSDAQMISVDNTNPVVPELVIHSNVAFGTVKLDASGKVPLNQMSVNSASFLGYFDASSGALPVGTFNSGDYYAVSVQGTLTVYDPVTLMAAPTLVVVGSQLHYVSGSVSNPTGWYALTVSGTSLASDVQFIPGGTISSTNVQLAINELDSETQTALGGKAPSSASTGAGTSFPASGSISSTNVTSAIQELDTETVKLTGGTMTGNLIGTDFSAPTIGVGVSATPANNFALDASTNNGTMKLARDSGSIVMTVAANDSVAFTNVVESTAGGFKFPDGTVQATAAPVKKFLDAKTTGQTVNAGTPNYFNSWGVTENVGTIPFNPSNGQVTPNVAGLYLVNYYVDYSGAGFGSSGDAAAGAAILKNGVNLSTSIQGVPVGGYPAMQGSVLIRCDGATDWFAVVGQKTSASPTTPVSAGIQVFYMGP